MVLPTAFLDAARTRRKEWRSLALATGAEYRELGPHRRPQAVLALAPWTVVCEDHAFDFDHGVVVCTVVHAAVIPQDGLTWRLRPCVWRDALVGYLHLHWLHEAPVCTGDARFDRCYYNTSNDPVRLKAVLADPLLRGSLMAAHLRELGLSRNPEAFRDPHEPTDELRLEAHGLIHDSLHLRTMCTAARHVLDRLALFGSCAACPH